LNHPGLVTVFDVVEDDGRPLVVTELVDAPSLFEVVARNGTLSDERAADLGIQILDALAAAQAHGIRRLDVSPANVVVHGSGRAQLRDLSPATGPSGDLSGLAVTLSFSLGGRPSRLDPVVQEVRGPSPSVNDVRRRLGTLHEELAALEATGELPALD